MLEGSPALAAASNAARMAGPSSVRPSPFAPKSETWKVGEGAAKSRANTVSGIDGASGGAATEVRIQEAGRGDQKTA